MAHYRVASLNLQYGGIRNSTGAFSDRWEALVDVLRGLDAHILLLQEAQSWCEHNRQQAARAEKALGLRIPWDALHSNQSTTLMYDPKALHLAQWESRYRRKGPHGFVGVAVFEVSGVAVPLAVGSAHLPPDSTEAAAERVKRLAWRLRRYGEVGILGGDINHFPAHHPMDPAPPDPDTLPATNVMGRWCGPVSEMRPDRSIGDLLARGRRWTDVAQHCADQSGDATLLAPTAPGGIRVDQFHVTEPVVPALVDYQVVEHAHSDHAALVMTIETRLIDPTRVVAANA